MNEPKLDILSKDDRVKQIMEQYPETRDNDNRLAIRFWQSEKKELRETAGIEYLLWHNKLTPTKSIERSRRRVEKKHPELRGDRYGERRNIIEPQVREDMQA